MEGDQAIMWAANLATAAYLGLQMQLFTLPAPLHLLLQSQPAAPPPAPAPLSNNACVWPAVPIPTVSGSGWAQTGLASLSSSALGPQVRGVEQLQALKAFCSAGWPQRWASHQQLPSPPHVTIRACTCQADACCLPNPQPRRWCMLLCTGTSTGNTCAAATNPAAATSATSAASRPCGKQ